MNFGEIYTIIKDDPNDPFIEVRYPRMHMPYNVYQSAMDSIRTHEKNIFNSGINMMLQPSVEAVPPLPVEAMPPPPPVDAVPPPLPPQPPKVEAISQPSPAKVVLPPVDVNNFLSKAVNLNTHKSNKTSQVCLKWINKKCYNINCDKKHYIDGMYKKSICRFWQKGYCNLGSEWCTYAHGENDIDHDYNYYKSRDRSRSRTRDKWNY